MVARSLPWATRASAVSLNTPTATVRTPPLVRLADDAAQASANASRLNVVVVRHKQTLDCLPERDVHVEISMASHKLCPAALKSRFPI